ncbi:hypothetical protein DERF_009602 [Dermatophagoides farinae]|uniref:Uncharacterized protein n=1 Tax=Dermatophagoides farinae TaxID=6954 RepID=A0A922L2Q5_DERFA|nr:hypothetical protein DERF_009602 [Dermatophagoides farinae]
MEKFHTLSIFFGLLNLWPKEKENDIQTTRHTYSPCGGNNLVSGVFNTNLFFDSLGESESLSFHMHTIVD